MAHAGRWLLGLVVFAALVAATVAVAFRYGPSCELGATRCEDDRVELCVARDGGRDPGRTWLVVQTCEGAFPTCREAPFAACAGGASCEGCPPESVCVHGGAGSDEVRCAPRCGLAACGAE